MRHILGCIARSSSAGVFRAQSNLAGGQTFHLQKCNLDKDRHKAEDLQRRVVYEEVSKLHT